MKVIFLFVLLAATAPVQGVPAAASSIMESERVDTYVRERMSALDIPGMSLAVIHDGILVLAKGYGMANLELSVPATPDTVYHLASVTKTFTAIATMMLVEEGRISLDDAVARHVSDLPARWNPITIRQLLSHTSGIASFSSQSTIRCPVGKGERDYQRADVLQEVACLPLEFAPGDGWAYGDTGYHVLGMLIERVAGQDYERFLRTRIFEPLEMHSTRLGTPGPLIPLRADGYARRDGVFRNAAPLPPFEFANAGLVSTVLDMAKFDVALDSDRLLRREMLHQMWSNARLNSGDLVPSYGLGFGLTPFQGRRRVGHSGGGGFGYAAAFARFPDDNVSVIILSNADQRGFVISDMANEIASYYFPGQQ